MSNASVPVLILPRESISIKIKPCMLFNKRSNFHCYFDKCHLYYFCSGCFIMTLSFFNHYINILFNKGIMVFIMTFIYTMHCFALTFFVLCLFCVGTGNKRNGKLI